MADETVMVQAGPKVEPGKVVLWERSDAHPDNEVYVTAPAAGEDAKPVTVGRTATVEGKLRSGELVDVSKGHKAAKPSDDK